MFHQQVPPTPAQRWPLVSVFRLVGTYDMELIWWADGLKSLHPLGFEALRAGGLKRAIALRHDGIQKSACKHPFTARQVDTNHPRSLPNSWWFLPSNLSIRVWLGQTTGDNEKVNGFDLREFQCSLTKRYGQMQQTGEWAVPSVHRRNLGAHDTSATGPPNRTPCGLSYSDSHEIFSKQVPTAILYQQKKKNKRILVEHKDWEQGQTARNS